MPTSILKIINKLPMGGLERIGLIDPGNGTSTKIFVWNNALEKRREIYDTDGILLGGDVFYNGDELVDRLRDEKGSFIKDEAGNPITKIIGRWLEKW